jgi:site-specific recombinase XerD
MAHVEKYKGHLYVRYKDEDGKWKREACGQNANRSDADFLAKNKSAQELNYHHKAPVRIIASGLPQALSYFRENILPRSSIGIDKQQSSIAREQATVSHFIDFVEERCLRKFKSFDKEMAQIYMDTRKALGIKPKTLREERRLLRKFFTWAIKQNYCVENPTEELVIPKLTKKNPRYFSEAELSRIFAYATEPYLRIFKFLFLTGLRTGELTNLEWQDYNDEEHTLTIRVVAADKKKRTPGNKTKREESIPLTDDAIQILKQRKEANESDTFIFLNQAGNRLDNDNIYRNLKVVLDNKNVKIKNAHPHTFRHTFASHLVIKGVSLYVVKELLRHASIKETEVYAHLSRETTRTAVQLLKLSTLPPAQKASDVVPAVTFLQFASNNTPSNSTNDCTRKVENG